MRSYIISTFILLIVWISLYTASLIFLPLNVRAEYYQRPMLIEKEAMAAERPSPRILLFGGSSVLFGIDAARIERETGIPAVNFGLIGSVRLERLLREADKVARPRDLVLLSLETNYLECHEHDWAWSPMALRNALTWDREDFFSRPLMEQVLAILTSGADGVLIDQWLGLVSQVSADRAEALEPRETVLARWRSGREQTHSFKYSQFNLDANGDMMHTEGTVTFHDNLAVADNPWNPADGTENPGICPATESVLTNFVTAQRQRGVRVAFSHSPLMILGQPAPGWQEAERKFRADIERTGAPLIDDRSEIFFPRSAFFDTHRHLNAEARAPHTERLIAHLRQFNLIPAENSGSDLPASPSASPERVPAAGRR